MEFNVKDYGQIRDKAVGAFLGAAYGDSLGWPNERNQSSKKNNNNVGQELRGWSRSSGGRYFPHTEYINSGEYSDDTQLILAVSRSLLSGGEWFHHWVKIELPFWLLYERGGGGATKRAAKCWTSGTPPWKKFKTDEDVLSYLKAGGNGVAMRVLPHIVFKATADRWSSVRRNILLDGIATHGDPHALLGALVYGYALWTSIKRSEVLSYGGLIDEVSEGITDWSEFPKESEVSIAWLECTKLRSDYLSSWENAVEEIKKYLRVCKDAISKGALTFDDEVLKKLDCFSKEISGSGIVAAMSAIYLASRYASEPMNGVVKAAFSFGSDTDTIASMTGGLLGTINGSEWIRSYKDNIQDSKYLISISKDLCERNVNERPILSPKFDGVDSWLIDLLNLTKDSLTLLPYNKQAKVAEISEQIGKTGKFKVDQRKLITEDGQTLYISKISKGDFTLKQKSKESVDKAHSENECGIKIMVSSETASLKFYSAYLGLKIRRQSSETVVFTNGLMLVSKNYNKNFKSDYNFRSIIYLKSSDIEKCFFNIKSNDFQILSELSFWKETKIKFFRCLDPDENIVEVFANN